MSTANSPWSFSIRDGVRSTHSEKDRGLILPRANAKPPGADPGSLAMGGSTPMIKAWAILATHVGEVGLAATSSRRWLGKLVFHYPCLT
jgi:hypothetical protein